MAGKTKYGKRGLKVYEVDDTITKKQEDWIKYYLETLNQRQATQLSGYKGSDSVIGKIGSDNYIRFEKIINHRLTQIKNDQIADTEDIFKFWTDTFYNEDTPISQRLKASELLAKAKGAFIEKVEVKQVDADWFK